MPKPRPKGVGDGEQVNIPVPPWWRQRRQGETEKGRSAGCWMSRFKPVDGGCRKIRSLIQRREVMTSDSLGSREVIDPMLPRNASWRAAKVTVPQTDSGGRVEYTKALERTVVKELCKLAP